MNKLVIALLVVVGFVGLVSATFGEKSAFASKEIGFEKGGFDKGFRDQRFREPFQGGYYPQYYQGYGYNQGYGYGGYNNYGGYPSQYNAYPSYSGYGGNFYQK